MDNEYETKTLVEILAAPVSALQGLSERAAKILGEVTSSVESVYLGGRRIVLMILQAIAI